MAMMTIRRGSVAAVGLFMLAVSAVHAGQARKFDVSGTWIFQVQTDAGSGTPTVMLKQDGETLTGHYSSATLGEADLAGTVKGSEIVFAFNADVQGSALAVSYKGTIESNTSMKGSLSITGIGEGTFTGKKK